MAAVAAPYGLRPIRSLAGGGYASGHTRPYKMTNSYGTSVFYGDVMEIVTAGTVEREADLTDVSDVIGVFQGCTYTDPTLNYKLHSNMWTASTSATDIVAYICDDPLMIYQIQADGTVAQADMGLNADWVHTAGNANIGMSKVVLDQSTLAVTATLPLKIVGFVDGPDSAVGDAYTDLYVMINNGDHHYMNATGI